MRVYVQMAGLDAPHCSLGCYAGVCSAWSAGQVWGRRGENTMMAQVAQSGTSHIINKNLPFSRDPTADLW